ncbi:MAG: hypothetical protein P1V51_05455 [Deltaproteobacteria bacterium]|nr:hypothetical protein [Deltaproteobacteria bacterium]
MKTPRTIALLALPLLLAACPEEKAPLKVAAPAEAEAPAPADAPPAEEAPAPGAPLVLSKLGLKLDLPADATVMDMLGVQVVTGGGTVVSVSAVKPEGIAPETFAEAKAARDDFSPTKVGKEEETADGWLLTFENEGGGVSNYWVWMRRTLEGQAYECKATVGSPEQAARAEAACASLRK